MNVLKDIGFIGVTVGYSCSVGQILALPGAVASLVAASIFGSIELGYHCRANAKNCTAENKERFELKKINAKRHAENSCRVAGMFALGAVPVAGGLCAILFLMPKKNSKE